MLECYILSTSPLTTSAELAAVPTTPRSASLAASQAGSTTATPASTRTTTPSQAGSETAAGLKKRVRQRLREDGVKLWDPPYTYDLTSGVAVLDSDRAGVDSALKESARFICWYLGRNQAIASSQHCIMYDTDRSSDAAGRNTIPGDFVSKYSAALDVGSLLVEWPGLV